MGQHVEARPDLTSTENYVRGILDGLTVAMIIGVLILVMLA